MPNTTRPDEPPTRSISAGRVRVGDLITIPGSAAHRGRVRAVRSVATGVKWLYLTDENGKRLAAPVALPLNQTLVLHPPTRRPEQ